MYAKIFSQIFDSSIAENYEVRHVFEDLLKLADKEGCVDMTQEAIARRTNAPIEKIRMGIEELMKPDARSRSKEQDGRRLILIDSNRDWGWIIVNYAHYRALRDEESRRAYFRNAKRESRAKKSKVPKSHDKPASAVYRAKEKEAVRALEAGDDATFERLAAS